MKVCREIINFIRAGGFNHCLFKNFLSKEWDSDHGDVVYLSDVRWLSHAKALKRISELKDAIQEFMNSTTLNS